MVEAAIYARVSTDEQNPQRQIDDCRSYLEREYEDLSIEQFVDIVSGKADQEEHEDYMALIGRLDEFDVIAVDEVSRLSRLGPVEIHRFIDDCYSNGASIHILEIDLHLRQDVAEMQRHMNELFVSMSAKFAEMEIVQQNRRIIRGIRAAQRAGKWTGRPPAGFKVVDNRLRPVTDPDEGDTFWDIEHAIRRVLDGESAYHAAKGLDISYQGLQKIADDRPELYLDEKSSDDRVEAALSELG